jgi:hypothetical protein
VNQYGSIWKWRYRIYLGFILLCLVVPLQAFRTSYFYYDDFNCLYLAQQQSLPSLLGHLINPLSAFFRPLYLLVYWLYWHLFVLRPLPYHMTSWIIHGVNVLLVFLILKDLNTSEISALAGAIFFAYQSVFREIFYNFACVGEPLCATLFFLGLFMYGKRGQSVPILVLSWTFLFFALKTKEMAVSLPLVWLVFEVILGGNWDGNRVSEQKLGHPNIRLISKLRRLAKSLFLPFVYIALYLFIKVPDMGRLVSESLSYSPAHPYYTNYSAGTMISGYAWYFNAILRTGLTPSQWCFIWVLFIANFVWRKNWQIVFWISYIFVTFLPVIGLVNRRLPYYWYIPLLGLCGIVAQLLDRIVSWIKDKTQEKWIVIGEAAFVVVFCLIHFSIQHHLTRSTMKWVYGLAEENRRFVSDLSSLPKPRDHTILYFHSVPQYFDPISTKAAVCVVLRRLDLDVAIRQDFPLNAND